MVIPISSQKKPGSFNIKSSFLVFLGYLMQSRKSSTPKSSGSSLDFNNFQDSQDLDSMAGRWEILKALLQETRKKILRQPTNWTRLQKTKQVTKPLWFVRGPNNITTFPTNILFFGRFTFSNKKETLLWRISK